jgi:hypothetical protein
MKPTQYVDPFMFGDPYFKKTGFWLKNLPKLIPQNAVEPIAHWVDSRTRGICRNSKERSRTFQGLAEAMACQWG